MSTVTEDCPLHLAKGQTPIASSNKSKVTLPFYVFLFPACHISGRKFINTVAKAKFFLSCIQKAFSDYISYRKPILAKIFSQSIHNENPIYCVTVLQFTSQNLDLA